MKTLTLKTVQLFTKEHCCFGPDEKVGTVHIYDVYKKWCYYGLNQPPLSRNKFHNQIQVIYPAIYKDRIREEGIYKRGFKGIGVIERIE